MAGEDAVVIRGIEPVHATWRMATKRQRLAFWKRAGEIASFYLKDQLRLGKDRHGKKMPRRKRLVLPDGARGPVLSPHYAESRSFRLLRSVAAIDHVTLYWSHGWGRVLGYHGRGEVLGAPVRDVRGLSPANARRLKDRMRTWWATEHAIPIVVPVPKPPKVVYLKPGQVPDPRARAIQVGYEPDDEPIVVSAPKPPIPSRGVRVHPDSPQPVTPAMIARVEADLAKVPAKVTDAIEAAGGGMDLIAGRGITDHPIYAHLRGTSPRGWEGLRTWDDVPGAGGYAGYPRAVIAANRLDYGEHGSASLVIHEYAHTYDFALGPGGGSGSAEWRRAHESAGWRKPYLRDHPEEGYAESMAAYLMGGDRRAELPESVRAYWRSEFDE